MYNELTDIMDQEQTDKKKDERGPVKSRGRCEKKENVRNRGEEKREKKREGEEERKM